MTLKKTVLAEGNETQINAKLASELATIPYKIAAIIAEKTSTGIKWLIYVS